MGEVFYVGETKTRPGAYYNVDRTDYATGTDSILGIGGCVFKADFGPLNTVVEVTKNNYTEVFGNALTTDVIKYLFLGGAVSVLACRIGSGGSESKLTLTGIGTITARYVGEKSFTLTVREKLTEATKKEIIIYDGTKIFEKYEIEQGGDEAAALAEAMAVSEKFSFTKTAPDGTSTIAAVSQSAFTAGTNPTVTVDSYSAGFEALESRKMNVMVVDTEDVAVHALLQAFVRRLADNARFALAFVAEKTTASLTYEDKMAHAVEFNDYLMHYVLNPKVRVNGEVIDGYQTAAMVAGLVSSYQCKYSMTHKVLIGATELLENVPIAVLNAAPLKGCIAITLSSNKEIWLDCGINTLINPAENLDDGWKTIRRVKTRSELIERSMTAADELVGEVDNDADGRAAIVSVAQGIINNMISEGSLTSGTAYEGTDIQSDGNYAYFGMDVIDKESAEKIYFTFRFQFSTNVSA